MRLRMMGLDAEDMCLCLLMDNYLGIGHMYLRWMRYEGYMEVGFHCFENV